MHSILVTFRCEIPVGQLIEEIGPKMEALKSTEGLVMKTFVQVDEHNPGGFYLFTSREAADKYIAGDFFKGFSSSPPISNVRIQHFDVADEPSAAFGTPHAALASAAA